MRQRPWHPGIIHMKICNCSGEHLPEQLRKITCESRSATLATPLSHLTDI